MTTKTGMRVYKRLAWVYDMPVGNKLIRWDSLPEARRFAQTYNRSRIRLIRPSDKALKLGDQYITRSTPAVLANKGVVRRLVKNKPHTIR